MTGPRVPAKADPGLAQIPLSQSLLAGNELEYLRRTVERNEVAAGGFFVAELERAFADRHGHPDAVSVSSGTAALHVALVALDIGPGDEVVVPSLTFIATVNAIRYVGATPVLADSDPRTYCLDPDSLEQVAGPRAKAVIPVHLFGHPADMDPILGIAGERGLAVVEDATEALGSRYRDRPCGTLGDVGCFSFNGNKVITAGGGGMALCAADAIRDRIRRLTLQARVPGSFEWLHSEIGFNYALAGIQAAVGLAQFERLDDLVERRRAVGGRYAAGLRDVDGLMPAQEAEWAHSNNWLQSVLIDEAAYGRDRDGLAALMDENGIETRPFFYPVHLQEPYRELAAGPLPVAEDLHARALCLPSSAWLEQADQDRVIDVLRGG